MKISQISIKRPVTTFMMVGIILLLGFIAFSRLNVELLPDIKFPVAVISTEYRGAGPQEVENIITRNIENVVATVSNAKTIQSVSSENNSLVIVEFNYGTHMDFAALEIREKIDMIVGMLPDGVSRPMVMQIDPDMLPIMTFGISDEQRDLGSIKLWAEDVLKSRLERIEGVASVSITGGRDREIQVVIDPRRLNEYGISMTQIVDGLRMENISFPGGVVQDGSFDLLVRTTGEFESVQDIMNISVLTHTGTSFLLGDIASVEDGFRQDEIYSKINGQDSITVSIQKESTANTVRVSDRVNEEIKSIQEQNKDLQIMMVIDQASFIKTAITNVGRNALIGGILAVLVLFIFLKSIRPTLVVGTAIPVCIIATFIPVYFWGLTINLISLGGLALGIGMLVDNSIVVMENIYRKRQSGLNAVEAAIEGSSEIAMAITASTLTTISVFLPIVFIEGITAEIFKELALTVTFSLIVSLIIALTLVPMLSSRILDKNTFEKKNKILSRVNSFYMSVLRWAVRHRKIIVSSALMVFLGSLVILQFLGTEFLPGTDQGQINITVRMPRGTGFEQTLEATQQVERIIDKIPEVRSVSVNIGEARMGGIMGGSRQKDRGSFSILLNPADERQRSTREIGEWLRKETKNIAGAEIRINVLEEMFGGFGGGFGSGVGAASVAMEIKGDDLVILNRVSNEIKAIVEGVEGIRDVQTSMDQGLPELRILLDRARASGYGLSTAMVSHAVQNSLQGVVATRYRVDGREIDVRVQLMDSYMENVSDLEDLLIASPFGINVPLREIAVLRHETGPISIERRDQTRMITVSAAVMNRSIGEVTNDIQNALKGYRFPPGYIMEYGGQSRELDEAFSSLKLALILAIILVYMIMASQFESFVHPFTIMFSVPIAFTGGLLGLLAVNRALSVPAILGIIVLAGIVVNNAIVLVEYINRLRREGIERNEAVLRAGSIRLRPILMTSMTTILALFPLALGIGEGTEIQIPLAATVIGGLVLSTVLTLVVIPVMYTIFDDLGERIRVRR